MLKGRQALKEAPVQPESREEKSVPSSSAEGRVLLFTTKTCPNCKMAGRLLDKAGIAYELIDAQEQAQLSERFSIMQAPTLLEVGADGSVDITAGAAAVFQKVNAMRAQVVA